MNLIHLLRENKSISYRQFSLAGQLLAKQGCIYEFILHTAKVLKIYLSVISKPKQVSLELQVKVMTS